MPGLVSDYRLVDELPTPLPEAAFSHALTLHPPASAEDRGPLLAESARLLAPHGQVLLAMPLRGSFQEIFDLLARVRAQVRRHVRCRSGRAGGARVADRRDAEQRARRRRVRLRRRVAPRRRRCASRAGATSSRIPSRASRSCPRCASTLNLDEAADRSLAYVREAIDKYWGGRSFELTVNVGCATGRRVP